MDALLDDFLDLPPTPTTAHPFDLDPALASGSASSSSSAANWAAPAPADHHAWPSSSSHTAFSFGASAHDDDDESPMWDPEPLDGAGIDLGEIAPLPGFAPASSSLFSSFYPSAAPAPQHARPSPADFLPQAGYAPFAPFADFDGRGEADGQSTPSPGGSSSHLSSLPPPTPPPTTAALYAVPPPSSLKRARSDGPAAEDAEPAFASAAVAGGSVNPYALSLASGSASPPPSTSSTTSSAAGAKPKKELTGTGKKRKSLPSVAEFQAPSTDGLSKKEARLVKNRAAAFLSRQRKRELFDELEVEVVGLREEVQRLRAAAAAAGEPKEAGTDDDGARAAALEVDLAHVRGLLHASTARERSLAVELASVRAQLATALGAASASSSSSSAAGDSAHQTTTTAAAAARGAGPMVSGFDGVGVGLGPGGGRAATRAERRREGERDGKRIGGVALMVIMFSFALFSFPSATLSSLPIRLAPPSSSSSSSSSSTSPFPAFLGRVLQASAGQAGTSAAERFGGLTIAKDTGGPVCTLKDKRRAAEALAKAEAEAEQAEANGTAAADTGSANATASDAGGGPMECDAPSSPGSSDAGSDRTVRLPSPASPPTAEFASDLAWPAFARPETARRSLSLTLLRPVPASLAERERESSPAEVDVDFVLGAQADADDVAAVRAGGEGVDDVLSRWLGLRIDDVVVFPSPADAADAGRGASSANADAVEGADGWLLLGPGAGAAPAPFGGGATDAVLAWDGTPLDRLELDDVGPAPAPSSAAAPLAHIDADANDAEDAPYRLAPHGAQYAHLAPPSPPLSAAASSANASADPSALLTADHYVRLDLSLDLALSVRRLPAAPRAPAVVGRAEAGRLLGRSAAAVSAGAGGGGLFGLGALEGLM